MSASRPHEYQPLKDNSSSFRLLEILPGTEPEITCLLHNASLENGPDYDALSYTWNDPRPTVEQIESDALVSKIFYVSCNGQRLQVGRNLDNALQQLREFRLRDNKVALQKYIWIDAICINQSDTQEKTQQVSQMGKIYQGAKIVVAWLGDSDQYTERAIHVVDNLPRSPINSFDDNHLKALVGLLRRAWFTRVWVIQEVFFAKRLVMLWGRFQINSSNFKRTTKCLTEGSAWYSLTKYAAMFISEQDRQRGEEITALGAVVGAFTGVLARLPLEMLSFFGRGSGATDRRDCVYAMQALLVEASNTQAGEALRLNKPDYSVTVEKAFTGYAAAFIARQGGSHLYLLSNVEDFSHRSEDLRRTLPSWVPDYSVSMMPMTLLFGTSDRHWRPSGMPQPRDASNVGDNLLHLDGAILDTIIEVATPFSDMEHGESWTSILQLVKTYVTRRLSGTEFADALWRTITADPKPNDRNHTLGRAFKPWLAEKLSSDTVNVDRLDLAQYEATIRALLQEMSNSDNQNVFPSTTDFDHVKAILSDPDIDVGGTTRKLIALFEATAQPVIGTRRLFVTANHHIGIGPQSTMEGDQVWVLPGATLLYNLRSTSTDGELKFVGEAYMHGAMRGEGANNSLHYKNISLV
jgi:hypothetical protein